MTNSWWPWVSLDEIGDSQVDTSLGPERVVKMIIDDLLRLA